MANKKKHITDEERFFIEKMLKAKENLTVIADHLNRGKSTIFEEVSKNGGVKVYSMQRSKDRAYRMQSKKKIVYNKVYSNNTTRNFIEKKLTEGLSPETISLLLKRRSKLIYASGKSIRKYIKNKSLYKNISKGNTLI